jgi:hypothetical protein
MDDVCLHHYDNISMFFFSAFLNYDIRTSISAGLGFKSIQIEPEKFAILKIDDIFIVDIGT